MDSFVFVAVLFGAACHAGWNAAIKVGLDTVLTTSLITDDTPALVRTLAVTTAQMLTGDTAFLGPDGDGFKRHSARPDGLTGTVSPLSGLCAGLQG